MSQSTADFLLARLREWDIHRIYGYPGDGINSLIGALSKAEDDPEFIQVRARGNGRIHGVRACEIHRRDWRLHGHLGAGRHSPLERSL